MTITINSTIYTDTPVRHRNGETYHISSISGGNDILRIDISTDDDAVVFTGTFDMARAAGFAFGDEEFTSCAKPYVDLPENFLAAVAELAYVQPATATPGDVKRIAEFAVSAHDEVHTQWANVRELTTAMGQANDARSALLTEVERLRTALVEGNRKHEAFLGQVRTAIIEYAKENDLCRPGTNEFLDGLGLDKWETTFTVYAKYNGRLVFEVADVEADSEADAIEEVSESLTVNVSVGKVTVDLECGVGGSESAPTTQVDAEDGNGWDGDDFIEWFKGELSWTADAD